MTNPLLSLPGWLIQLFDPPPLDAMTRNQKVVRALLVTVTLTVMCVFMAMLGTLGLFMVERGRKMLESVPDLVNGLKIIGASICVNTACVYVLLRIRRADQRLVPEQT